VSRGTQSKCIFRVDRKVIFTRIISASLDTDFHKKTGTIGNVYVMEAII
jgi:hypothetical protein